MDEQLRSIMTEVFKLTPQDSAALSEKDTVHTVNNWDSLGHIKLILSLEKRFHISITDQEAITLVSIGKIMSFLKEKAAVGTK